MVRRSQSDDYLGPAKGLMRWINRFFRFILFPFIHPLCFVIILAILGGSVVGIHYYYDVAYKDVPSWVWNKGKEGYNILVKKYDIKLGNNLVNRSSEVSKDVVAENKEVYQQPVLYDRPTVINRKAFKKAQDIPIDVKATVEGAPKLEKIAADVKQAIEDADKLAAENLAQSKEEVVDVKNEVQEVAPVVAPKTDIEDILSYRINDSFGLTYVKNPRVIRGQIEVVNANEIKVNNELMFLYGIFVQPSSDKGGAAELYLRKITENKEVECYVVAFTQNADLTAICIVDGYNLNHRMVEMGYSQNIGLK